MQKQEIFQSLSESQFLKTALSVFSYQYHNIPVYKTFCNLLKKNPSNVKNLLEIPFLPISFFKTKEVAPIKFNKSTIFSSSGTTSQQLSKHIVTDISWYKSSYLQTFEYFYGKIKDFCILGLLPTYLERTGSSLIYMVRDFILKSENNSSGFFLNEWGNLYQTLEMLEAKQQKTLLIGVSFALLDFIEKYSCKLEHTIVMETGGMKGKKKEITRQELHQRLCKGFGVYSIHSEYGMTELLSQAYSKAEGKFNTPPWMKIFIRDVQDPLSLLSFGKIGGINIIDLANINSCSFIATQDLGKLNHNGSFEILGRFDHSDLRGCNLMVL